MSRHACILLIAGLTMLPSAPAYAADKTQVVKFAAGARSATISDSLEGYDTNTYVLGANAGQRLTVTFKPSNSSCYYNVNGPGGGEAIYNGSMETDDYSGTLAASGNQSVMVYLMRNAARRNETCRFSVTFEISG